MVYPGSTGVAPRTGIVLAPQFGQNTAVAGTSMRQRGQLVVGSLTSPTTSSHYPPRTDIERRQLLQLLVRGPHLQSRNEVARHRSRPSRAPGRPDAGNETPARSSRTSRVARSPGIRADPRVGVVGQGGDRPVRDGATASTRRRSGPRTADRSCRRSSTPTKWCGSRRSRSSPASGCRRRRSRGEDGPDARQVGRW